MTDEERYDLAWDAILASDELAEVRRKLSIHELRLLIRAVLTGSAQSSANATQEALEPFASIANLEGWQQPEAIRKLSIEDFRRARAAFCALAADRSTK